MSENCKYCGKSLADLYFYESCPCMIGKSYKELELQLELDIVKQKLSKAIKSLEFYADPGNYHAITFIGDQPCGSFAEDFDFVEGSGYDRQMPGKEARNTLLQINVS
jgi:hypothetical protein